MLWNIRYKLKPHVTQNTGENEWYTPPEYVEAARKVMGSISLDPASSEIANRTVQATTFYSKENNGLDKPWTGNVFMNPPYSVELIKQFSHKFAGQVMAKNIKTGIVLVNNATETVWFRELIDCAGAVVFTSGRVRFLDPPDPGRGTEPGGGQDGVSPKNRRNGRGAFPDQNAGRNVGGMRDR